MRAQLEKRLEELRKEYERGLNELRDLETRQTNLRQTMLRISGAIQVIEEELKRDPCEPGQEQLSEDFPCSHPEASISKR